MKSLPCFPLGLSHLFAAVLWTGVFWGCGQQAAPVTEAELTPLTVAEWKLMSGNEKYSEATMNRLKLGDPSLETNRGWNRFLLTDMKQELAKDKPKQ